MKKIIVVLIGIFLIMGWVMPAYTLSPEQEANSPRGDFSQFLIDFASSHGDSNSASSFDIGDIIVGPDGSVVAVTLTRQRADGITERIFTDFEPGYYYLSPTGYPLHMDIGYNNNGLPVCIRITYDSGVTQTVINTPAPEQDNAQEPIVGERRFEPAKNEPGKKEVLKEKVAETKKDPTVHNIRFVPQMANTKDSILSIPQK